ncbi:hypothetical protein [Nocardioides marmotae]|uniref:hypothetical protein n=1 Tax=Nocardioides marmotae TaxID=2663857 RepID=UPI0012B5BFC9|nr:hypothetical protein [Nocardioides marmotae]MBC9734111.1 hypothetical protein [Nocardioides marmotae]MTB85214.1 hypothetical protein [Nocardioides marmotae]
MGERGAGATDWFESLRTVGRNRSLARLLLALTCSVMADAGFVTTAAVWANRAGGPGAVGAFTAATFAVSAVAAPVAALVGDRTARRTFLLVVDSVRLGCAAGAVACTALPTPVPTLLLAGAVGVLAAPARGRSTM